MMQCDRCPAQFQEGYYELPLDFGEGVKITVKQLLNFNICPQCFASDLQDCIDNGDPKIRDQMRKELREGILPNKVSIGFHYEAGR